MDKIDVSIDLGALDSLIKPIKPEVVQDLVSQIKSQTSNASSESGAKAYEKINSSWIILVLS